tara:strand:- start:10929 stop:11462 length:534 start_codon:yes stop_codon:yes gene_type:complete
MYNSSKNNRKKKRVLYSLTYVDSDPLSSDWYKDTSDDLKKNIENVNKIKKSEEPLKENVSPNVVVNNSVVDDPKSLLPPVKDEIRDNDKNNDEKNNQNENIITSSQDEYKSPSKKEYISNNGAKKTKFSIINVFLFFLVIIALFYMYKYFGKFKGKSFFGARECVSYDISNAYNMVR